MNPPLINIVLDVESLGTDENAAIIQIGAAIPEFDRAHIGYIDSYFIATISYDECLRKIQSKVFTQSNDAMQWWENQPSRLKVFSGQQTYDSALGYFNLWVEAIKIQSKKNVALWGNGSDFDNRLLAYTMSALGFKLPWEFRNNRDLRTLRALFPLTSSAPSWSNAPVDFAPGFRKHTALGDAMMEARVLHATWESYPHLHGVL